MAKKRKIEIFSAGCDCCTEAIDLVNKIACEACDIQILDMKDKSVSARAKKLGIKCVPSVVIDGKLVDCCSARGIDEATLKRAGVGSP